jgi:hypothetical protein
MIRPILNAEDVEERLSINNIRDAVAVAFPKPK